MKEKLFNMPEGKILLFGASLLVLYLVFLLFSWVFFPDSYAILSTISAANLFFGRAAGLSIGFATELPILPVVAINFFVETLLVLIIYPLFILGWMQLINIEKLKIWIDKSHQNAEKYRPVIQKYGIYGLFLFVWFPFWMTGPVVGSIIGYLMGLRHMITLVVVLVGTLIATICWAYFLLFLQNWASTFDERAPWFIAISFVLLAIIGLVMRKYSN